MTRCTRFLGVHLSDDLLWTVNTVASPGRSSDFTSSGDRKPPVTFCTGVASTPADHIWVLNAGFAPQLTGGRLSEINTTRGIIGCTLPATTTTAEPAATTSRTGHSPAVTCLTCFPLVGPAWTVSGNASFPDLNNNKGTSKTLNLTKLLPNY